MNTNRITLVETRHARRLMIIRHPRRAEERVVAPVPEVPKRVHTNGQNANG